MFTFILISVCGVSLSFADKYVTRQITQNTASDYSPSLYNGEIAWKEMKMEIMTSITGMERVRPR